MTQHRRIDRRGLFASAAAATLLAASGVSAHSRPKPGGRLRLALSGAQRTDNWLRGDGLFMQVARQGLVFDTLTEVAADGTLRGELATRWTPSDDASTWYFDLREGVTFHDGAPFTAEDVVASAQGFADGEVRATARHRVCFALHAPDPDLPMRLSAPAYFISAAHAVGCGIGTGLYRVRQFAPGQQLLTERVAQHYKDGQAGWFDEVELVSVPSERVRAQALGEYMVDAVDLSDAGAMADHPGFVLMPDQRSVVQAASRDLLQSAQIGFQRPMDNLRAAERWWFG